MQKTTNTPNSDHVSFFQLSGNVAKAGTITAVSNLLSFVSFGLIKMESLKRPIMRELKTSLVKYGIQVSTENQSEFLSKLKPKELNHNIALKELSEGAGLVKNASLSFAEKIGLGGAIETATEVLTDKATDFTLSSFATFMHVNPKIGWQMVDDTLEVKFKNYPNPLRYVAKSLAGTIISLAIVETYGKTDLKSIAIAAGAGMLVRSVYVPLKNRVAQAKTGTPGAAQAVKQEVQDAIKDAPNDANLTRAEILKQKIAPSTGRKIYLVVKILIYGTIKLGIKAVPYIAAASVIGLIATPAMPIVLAAYIPIAITGIGYAALTLQSCAAMGLLKGTDMLLQPLAKSIQRDITSIVVSHVVDKTLSTQASLTFQEQGEEITHFFNKYGITEFAGNAAALGLENMNIASFVGWAQEVPIGAAAQDDKMNMLAAILPDLLTGTLFKFFSTYMRVNKDVAWQQLGKIMPLLFDTHSKSNYRVVNMLRFLVTNPLRHLLKGFIKEHVIQRNYTNEAKFIAGASLARAFTTKFITTNLEIAEVVNNVEKNGDQQKNEFGYVKTAGDIFKYSTVHILNKLLKMSSAGLLSINSLERQYARSVRQHTITFLSEGEISAFAYAPQTATAVTDRLVADYLKSSKAGTAGALAKNLTDIGLEGLEEFSIKGAAISIKVNSSWRNIDDYVVKSLKDRGVTSSILVRPMRKIIEYLIGEYVVEPHIKDITAKWVVVVLAERVAMTLNFGLSIEKICTFASASFGAAKAGLTQAMGVLSYILLDPNRVRVHPEDIEEQMELSRTDKLAEETEHGYEIETEKLISQMYPDVNKDNWQNVLRDCLDIDKPISKPEYIQRRLKIAQMQQRGFFPNETDLQGNLDTLSSNYKQAKIQQLEALQKQIEADAANLETAETKASFDIFGALESTKDKIIKIQKLLKIQTTQLENLTKALTDATKKKEKDQISAEEYNSIVKTHTIAQTSLAKIETSIQELQVEETKIENVLVTEKIKINESDDEEIEIGKALAFIEKEYKFEKINKQKYDLLASLIQTKAEFKLGRINEKRYTVRLKRAAKQLEALEMELDTDHLGEIFDDSLLLPLGNKRGFITIEEVYDSSGKLEKIEADGISFSAEGVEAYGEKSVAIEENHTEKLLEIASREKSTSIKRSVDTHLGIAYTKVDPRFRREFSNVQMGFGKSGEVRERFDDMNEICDTLESVIGHKDLIFTVSKFLNKSAAKRLSSIIETQEHGYYNGEQKNTWVKNKDVYLRINKEEPSYTFDISKVDEDNPNSSIIITITTNWEVTEMSKSLTSALHTHKTSKKHGSLFKSSTFVTIKPKPKGWTEAGWIFDSLKSEMPTEIATTGFMNTATVHMHAETDAA